MSDTLPPLLEAEMFAYYQGEYIDGSGAKERLEAFARTYAEQYAAARVAQAVAQERERAAASPQPAPAGWRLAPEEATQAMVNEALSAVLTSPAGYAEIYRAMVNAAPQPPSATPPSAGEEKTADSGRNGE